MATRKNDEWPVDELKYMYRPYNRKKDEWDVETIVEFSPAIQIEGATVISLTTNLSEQLLTFLGTEFTQATTPDIMSPAQAQAESRMKHIAADKMLGIYSKHWGDGWHLISHPEVEQILFDREYRHALVAFRIVYQGGYSFYEKTADGWELSKSEINWIE